MSKTKQKLTIAGTASALAVFALGGTAIAQETTDSAYDKHSADAQKMESTMAQHKDMATKYKDEAHQMAKTFGVSELNDIEDWKITHAGQEIGAIDRLGIDASTGEILAVVGLDGVLGVNMKEVGIPLKKLQKAGEETLSTELTKEELQKARDIDPWDGTYSQVLKEGVTQ